MAYVIALDVGTSSLRCCAVDKNGCKVAANTAGLSYLQPQPGYSEIDPEQLWRTFKDVVTNTLTSGNLDAKEAACLGIATQRNTFCLWNRATGEPLCNFITWQDKRATEICQEWNDSFAFKMLHAGGSALHAVTRSKKFLVASVLTVQNHHVLPRLQWTYRHLEGAKELASEGKLCFGTIDTWLVWKLTGGTVHATDYSNVSSTVLFDAFEMKYLDNGLFRSLFSYPPSILPEVKDSGGLFGKTVKDIFGAEIPITCIITDQSSSMFAQGCWSSGDVNCTFGTGLYLKVNTGRHLFASTTGINPLIAWKMGDEVQFLAEAQLPSLGSVVNWGEQFGLYAEPSETDEIARSVSDSDGVCFVPVFNGIQVPHADPYCAASAIGITHNTRKEHMVRALLESLAYSFKQLFDECEKQMTLNTAKIRVDGGITLNDFTMQLCSDLIGYSVLRPKDVEMTMYGAAYMAGLAAGFWESRDEVAQLWQLGQQFDPKDKTSEEGKKIPDCYRRWQDAVHRSIGWHKPLKKTT